MFVNKKLEKFDQTFRGFLTKLKTNKFSLVFSSDMPTLKPAGGLILKHPQTKPFQGALQRLGLIRFIDKPVPALGIWKKHTQMQK